MVQIDGQAARPGEEPSIRLQPAGATGARQAPVADDDVRMGAVPRQYRIVDLHAAPRQQQVPVPASPSQANGAEIGKTARLRSEEHTSELKSLMRTSYDGFCLKQYTVR